MEPKHPQLISIASFECETFCIKSIALTETSDGLICAAGFRNGSIELYKNSIILKQLHSHKSSVNALQFSSYHHESYANDVPIILCSLSSEICFWDIVSILNNPMERTQQQRSSQRFNRQSKLPFYQRNGNIETNGNTLQVTRRINDIQLNNNHSNGKHATKTFNGNEIFDENPWIGKCGPSKKPELLACIKFVGSSAQKVFINKHFTTFITIDNEGEIYYLRTLDFIDDETS